ncbi:MAG: hypothetical protein WC397_02620 [Candidatus Paceibacterota bacterium]|jgi:hypothetical protein
MKTHSDQAANNSIFQTPEPPAELLGRIMSGIRSERGAKAAKRRAFAFSLGIITSLFVFVPAFSSLRQELAQSGFYAFFSLIFSDTEIVAAYWKNFAPSLLEALPATSLIFLLTAVCLFLQSVGGLLRNINFFNRKSLA